MAERFGGEALHMTRLISARRKSAGITIATAHVEYESDNRHYAHVDCPVMLIMSRI